MPNEHRFSVSEKEMQRILSLPKKSAMFDQGRFTGLYDELTERFYILDEAGKLTGASAIVPMEKFINDEVKRRVQDEDTAGVLKEKRHTETVFVKKRKKKKKADGALIAGIVTVVLLVSAAAFIILSRFGVIQFDAASSPLFSSFVSSVCAEEYTDVGSEGEVEIVVLKENKAEGERIEKDDIEIGKMDGVTYNFSFLSGNRILKWTEAEALFPAYADTYLTAGQAVKSSDISKENSVTGLSNPWLGEEDAVIVDIPISKLKVALGEYVTVTASGGAAVFSSVDKSYYENLKNVQYAYDTEYRFLFTGPVLVCDIISEDGESLFERASKLVKIPYGEAVKERNITEDFIPKYCKISIAVKQGVCLQKFADCGMKLSVDGTGVFDTSNSVKSSFCTLMGKLSLN